MLTVLPSFQRTGKLVRCSCPKHVFLQVGFESTAFQLIDVTSGTSQVTVTRRDTYGLLSVVWTTGYAPGLEIPEPVVIGNMTPTLGESWLF